MRYECLSLDDQRLPAISALLVPLLGRWVLILGRAFRFLHDEPRFQVARDGYNKEKV